MRGAVKILRHVRQSVPAHGPLWTYVNYYVNQEVRDRIFCTCYLRGVPYFLPVRFM